MHFKFCTYPGKSKSGLNKRTRNGCPSKLDCTPIYRSDIEGELEISEEEDSEVERSAELVEDFGISTWSEPVATLHQA